MFAWGDSLQIMGVVSHCQFHALVFDVFCSAVRQDGDPSFVTQLLHHLDDPGPATKRAVSIVSEGDFADPFGECGAHIGVDGTDLEATRMDLEYMTFFEKCVWNTHGPSGFVAWIRKPPLGPTWM